jgi:hypothetical protein
MLSDSHTASTKNPEETILKVGRSNNQKCLKKHGSPSLSLKTFILRHQVEVTTVDPRVIRRVDNDRTITEESDSIFDIRQEEIGVLNAVVAIRGPDGSMLSTDVANLAGLRSRGVARRLIAAFVRVEVSSGSVAVAILWHGLVVDVII